MNKVLKISSFIALILCLFALCSCAPKDLEAAKKKMEKKGYERVYVDTALTQAFSGYNVKGSITFSDGDKDLTGIAILFSSKAEAKKYWNDHKDDINKAMESDDDYLIRRVGKWIVSGDRKAVKAFL